MVVLDGTGCWQNFDPVGTFCPSFDWNIKWSMWKRGTNKNAKYLGYARNCQYDLYILYIAHFRAKKNPKFLKYVWAKNRKYIFQDNFLHYLTKKLSYKAWKSDELFYRLFLKNVLYIKSRKSAKRLTKQFLWKNCCIQIAFSFEILKKLVKLKTFCHLNKPNM